VFYTIAESDLNDPKVIRPAAMGGYGFTAQWMDDFHHALYTVLDKEALKFYGDFGKIEQLAKAYKDGFVHSGEYVNFRKRKYGASSAGITGDHFVVFAENHDQAGNRVTGSRLSTLIGFEKTLLAVAATLLSPYVPMLFMGEEFGDDAPFLYFISHEDQELVEMVRRGRKKEFEHHWDTDPVDPYPENTFIQSKIRWNKLAENPNQKLHSWYKELIQLRQTQPALQNFDKSDLWLNANDGFLEFYRTSSDGNQVVCAIFNFSEEAVHTCMLSSSFPTYKKLLDSRDGKWAIGAAQAAQALPGSVPAGEQIIVPPLTVVVYGNE
jgi:maltooligosyltrehalose trehalohydrolase